VILLLALASFAALAQTPENNLQAVLQLFDRVAYRVAESMSHDGAAAIWVKAPANLKPEERFFFSRLTTVLSDSLQWRVFADPVDSLQTTALIYQLHRCEIIYRPLPRRRFWRKSRWQRSANIIVELGAQNASTRQIVFQKIFEESAADTLAENSLRSLEDQNLAFTIGRRESREQGSRWLEAALITSATGAVIYLFYSLRSR
jgi:hypothetical protein